MGASLCIVGTVVRNNKHIEGSDPAFLAKADFHSALKTGARAPDESLLFAANAHHHRGVGLLRQECRDNHGDAAGYFAAEPATRIFANENDFARIDVQPSREGRQCLESALSARVNVHLAVLPVGHRTARLEGLMADVWRDKCFVKYKRGIFETRVEVAIRPLVRRLAHRQTAVSGLGEVRIGPLEFRDRRRRATWRSHPDVAVSSWVRTTGPQRIERIDDKRKPLEINVNPFDRLRGGEFVGCRHRENRFALVQRLHRESPFAPLAGLNDCAVVGKSIGWSGKIVRRKNRPDAGHR